MSDTPDVKSCVSRGTGERLQAPHCSLHYHFGMLLGVTDLETEQAYHRGKMWLHTGWLHREGVVWGFDVQADAPRGEIRVLPGLAVDALGREIHLEADACLNFGAWFEDRRKKSPEDAGWFTEDATTGAVTFDAHVVIRFKTCLMRQVPALSEPCEGAGTATAYSRLCETVEILFRPGLWPDPFGPAGAAAPQPRPYHRVRLLRGLDEPLRDGAGDILPGDLEVLQAPRDAASLHRFAVLDEIDLRPLEGAEFPVVLANVRGLTLVRDATIWKLTVEAVDVGVRPVHVATAAFQDLLLGGGAPAGGSAVILPGSVSVDLVANQITFVASSDLSPTSVQVSAFALTAFDPAVGWSGVTVDTAAVAADKRTVTLAFAGGVPTGATLVRLLVRGTGSSPVLDAHLVPLNHGQDFVHDHRRS